jgi:hypothetical protein
MRCGVLAVVAIVGGCDDYGPDFDNAVVYPGPCSSRVDYADGSEADSTYEYANGLLTAVFGEYRSATTGGTVRHETLWRRDPGGSFVEVVETLTIEDSSISTVWAFDSSRVVVTRQEEVWSIYDRATFEFHPMVGSQVRYPIADLGLIERGGVPYAWSMDGALLVRTSVDERATYERDDLGRIIVIRRDLANDGSVDVVVQHIFDGDRLMRTTGGTANNPWTVSWRYDAAGNVATSEGGSWSEEYDYRCW